jgi:hypothetical protein
MIALFLIHEVLRWFAPWGSWLGGPGFTYQRVDGDSGSTEMKDFSPENKIPWMNKRAPQVRVHSNLDASRNQPCICGSSHAVPHYQQPPLVVKVCLWILQVGLAVAIIGLWIATAVGIGEKVRILHHHSPATHTLHRTSGVAKINGAVCVCVCVCAGHQRHGQLRVVLHDRHQVPVALEDAQREDHISEGRRRGRAELKLALVC